MMSKTIKLDPLLTIAEAAGLRASLEAELCSSQDVVVDASAVTATDTAGIQLLAVFCQEAASRGIGVQWKQTGSVIPRAAELLGLSQALNLPQQTESTE